MVEIVSPRLTTCHWSAFSSRGTGGAQFAADTLGASHGNLEVVILAANRRGPAPQFGVHLLNVVDRDARPLSDPAQIHPGRNRDDLGLGRQQRLDIIEPVFDGIFRDEYRRKNHRDVIACLARQRNRDVSVRLQKSSRPLLLDRPPDAAGTAVVGRHRQVPVVEGAIERLEIFGGCQGGLGGIGTLVDVPILLQTVLAPGPGA